jgi:LacI family repressor for deo operon, udp, cdd, tsx, nupC, and nupG
MKVTIKDIARECAVSVGTVSGVLHNKDNVKESTKKKVQDAIKRLKYDPLQNIPLARKVKTKTIGLVVPNVNFAEHPLVSRTFGCIKEVTSANGFNCMYFSEGEIRRKTVEEFYRGPGSILADGLIIFCPNLKWDNYLKVLKKWEIPAVLVRRRTKVKGISTISDDDREAMKLILDHLAGRGHTRVGYVEEGDNINLKPRVDFYESYIKRHRMFWDKKLVFKNVLSSIFSDPEVFISEYIQSLNPTAIICSADRVAIEIIKALKAHGIRVPEDIAITGHDNNPPAHLFSPGITTVNMPVPEMCELGVRILADHFKGLKVEAQDIKLKNELVIRESCGAKT